MKRASIILLLLLSVLTLVPGASAQIAVDTSTALYSGNLRVANEGSAQSDLTVPFHFSGQSLVDQNFINPDGLNSVVVGTDGNLVPAMPGSLQLDMKFCKQYDDGTTTYTDYTTECNDDTTGDIDFYPATPAANDAFLFGFDYPGRILSLSISQAADWDAVIVWYYWDGSAWSPLENVNDTSSGFTNDGFQTLSFDMPSDWTEATVDSDAAYWIRADVDSVSSTTTLPLGTRSWWETGTWWTFVPSISQNEQINYTLFLGGSADFNSFHYIFPGSDGITTPDDASIELGEGYTVTWNGYLNPDAGSSAVLVEKTSAIKVYWKSAGELALDINGSEKATVSGIPAGEAEVQVFSDGTSITLSVEGVGSDSAADTGVTDNANDWTWVNNSAMYYVEEIKISFPLTDADNTGSAWSEGTHSNTQSKSVSLTPDSTFSAPTSAPGDLAYDSSADSLWVSDFTGTTIYEVNPSTGATKSSCSAPTGSAVRGIGWDGTNLWVSSQNDDGSGHNVLEINTSCVKQSGFSADQGSSEYGLSLAVSTVDGNIWIFDPNTDDLMEFNTSGALQSRHNEPTGTDALWGLDFSSDGFMWASSTVGDEVFKLTGDGQTVYTSFTAEGDGDEGYGVAVITPDTDIRVSDNGDDEIESYDASSASPALVLQQLLSSPQNWSMQATSGTGTETRAVEAIDPQTGTWRLRMGCQGTGQSPCGYQAYQRIATSEGEVWSLHGYMQESGNDLFDEAGTMYLRFLDSDFNTLAEVSRTTSNSTSWVEFTIDNQSAPANTAWVEARLWGRCTSGIACSNSMVHFDSIILCDCASAPAFSNPQTGDPLNELENPGFEKVYRTSGNRISPGFNVGSVTSVESTSISWNETLNGNTITVETSIDGGSTYQTPTNGGSIPGINEGDDLTGKSITTRVTMSGDGYSTPETADLIVLVTGEDDVDLQYQLQTMPTLTLDDLAGTNDGALSFPQNSATSISISQDPLDSTQTVENKQDQALSPDVASEVDPGNWQGGFDGSGIPFNDLWVAMSNLTGGDIPPIMYWVVFATWIVILAGLVTFVFTQSVPWAAAVMGIFMLGFVNFGEGLLPMWVFFFFGMMAMASSIYVKVRSM